MRNALKRFNHWPLAALLMVFIILAAVYSLTVPLDEVPDEEEHFALVRFIVRQKRPPLTIQEQESVGYKGDASPIYHSLVALLSQHTSIGPLPQRHTLGASELFIIYDTFLTNRDFHTEDESFPFRGIVLAWHLARLASIPLAATTLIAVYLTSLAIFPNRRGFALAVAAFAAFVPRFSINSAVINDDNLAIPLTTFAISLLVWVMHGHHKRGTLMALGLVIALASMVKYHALVLVVEMTLALAFVAWRRGWGWKAWLQRWAWVMFGFVILAGTWFLVWTSRFNRAAEFGSAKGLLASLGDTVIVDTPHWLGASQALKWDWMVPLFRSFWLALRSTRVFAPDAVYYIFLLITLIATVGLIRWGYVQLRSPQSERESRSGMALLALHFLVYLGIVFVRYQTRAAMGEDFWVAPHNVQGRHLYPALVSVAFFYTLGFSQALRSLGWLPQWLQGDKSLAVAISGVLIGLGAIAYFLFIRPTYYLPYFPIRLRQPEEIAISHRADTRFVEGVRFVGYDVESPGSSSRGMLPVTLYWQAESDQQRDYLIQLCVYDASGRVVTCHWGHPLDGLFPTRAWVGGYVIRDETHVPLPDCLPAGDYEVRLWMVPLRDDSASTEIDQAASRIGPLTLGTITLPGRQSHPTDGVQICAGEMCRPQGEIELSQIRRSLVVMDSNSHRHASENDVSAARLVYNDSGVPYQRDWLPSGEVTSYQCPDARWVTMYHFVADRSVTPGQYRLEIGDRVQEDFRVVVKTRWRNFESPTDMQTALNISYANQLELLGYEVDLSPRWSDDTIQATLYWRAQKTTDRSYVVTLHLLDNQMAMQAQTDHTLAGLYPNVLWAPGEIVPDIHTLQAEDGTLPPGLYTIELGVYYPLHGQFFHLPMTSVATGQTIERNPILGEVRVMDLAQKVPPAHPVTVNLGDQIRLVGYDLAPTRLASGDRLSLALHWQAIDQPVADYTVFTQLIGPDGLVWGQKDNQPQEGRYPTTVWNVGDKVVDRYELQLKEGSPAGEYRLLVGMYDLTTGERLSATQADGNRLPDDAVTLANITVE